MSSARKSARNRSTVNYVGLLGYDSDEDDFLIDGSDIPKKTKRKKECRGDDECVVNTSSIASPLKGENMAKGLDFAAVQGKGRSCTARSASIPDAPPRPLTNQPIFSVPGTILSSSTEPETGKSPPSLQVKHPNDLPSSTKPSPPLVNSPALVCVTPYSALRLGLSRKNIREPLHPNIRLPR